MGAGPNWNAVKSHKYRALKKVQAKLQSLGVDCKYASLEVSGDNFVVYFAGIGPASNGEYFAYKVLRYNAVAKPDPNKKSAGDIDFTDFHNRDIPEHSKGGFEAGVAVVAGKVS